MRDSADTEITGDAVPPVAAETSDPLDVLTELGIAGAPNLTDEVRPLAQELIRQIDPQNAAERMIAVQVIAAFSRSMFLSRNANRQKNPAWFELYATECWRAAETFRKQMQMLIDLRRPRRTSFTSIRRANITSQQILMTTKRPRRTRAASDNPKLPDAQPLQKTQASLPPEQDRPGRPASELPAAASLDP